MPYKQTLAKKPKALISDALRRYFETGKDPEDPEDLFDIFVLPEETKKEIWHAAKNEILEQWIKEKPGSRPWAWWRWDAPRQLDQGTEAFWEGTLPDPRRRLSGIGTPAYMVLAYVPHFSFGIPETWVSKWDEDYYNGRAKDIHGNPIGTEYREGDFTGQAIDPTDPPVFESEAAYLSRHNFLTEAEWKYLSKHPEALEAEVITVICS